jgi:hypothetical protein
MHAMRAVQYESHRAALRNEANGKDVCGDKDVADEAGTCARRYSLRRGRLRNCDVREQSPGG